MKKKRKMFAGLKIMSTFATQMRNKLTQSKCPDGGIGRRVGLKHQWIHFHPGSIPGLGTRNPDNIDCQVPFARRAVLSLEYKLSKMLIL